MLKISLKRLYDVEPVTAGQLDCFTQNIPSTFKFLSGEGIHLTTFFVVVVHFRSLNHL